MNPLAKISAKWAETAPTLVEVLTNNRNTSQHAYLLCQALLLQTKSHIDLLENITPYVPDDRSHVDPRTSTIECFGGVNAKMSRVVLHANARGFVFFGSRSSIRNVQVVCPKGFCIIIFGPNTDIQDAVINISQDPGIVVLSSGATASGLNIQVGEHGDYVTIGDDCMFSTTVAIRTSDNHGIYDLSTMQRINQSRPVVLHNHVWIGRQVSIGKGSEIGRDTVIGQGSMVSGRLKSNCIYAGVPAKELRQGVTWDRLKAETLDLTLPTASYRTRQLQHERTCASISSQKSRSLIGLPVTHALSRILAVDMDEQVVLEYCENLEAQSLTLDALCAMEAHALRLASSDLPLSEGLSAFIRRLRSAL